MKTKTIATAARKRGYAILLNPQKERGEKGKYSLFEEYKGVNGKEIHGFNSLRSIWEYLNVSSLMLDELE